MQISATIQHELVHDPVPDLLICDCLDGVLAIGQQINFLHTEPIHDVVRMYSKVFNCLAFLKTDASTKELTWLTTRQHDNNVLWMLAEPTMPPNCQPFIHILAIATAEAVAAIEARGLGVMTLDSEIRALRWRVQDIRKEAKDKKEIPELSPLEGITSCGCKAAFSREGIIKDDNGSWRVTNKSEELSTPAITFKASAEQMLWLSQYPSFSLVLRTLHQRFGASEVEIQNFLALEAGVNIGMFKDTLEDWLEGIDNFICELERMLIEGVIIPEI
ncbi:hypothetical protein F4824DRAFT_458127 [Ustulina deusta]|nr:hypothetical protein F4824DRAFT_484858 [Ustulina deusta]KAI3327463.1 hypothetical protein F4824DRAFT_484697 [Ustulina deusta]KAI3327477.1 hypothetical protein F4824DRAFT_484728 [Ustulina deusta]KAI3339086.1 hypothetical protein F4824DRAFT_458127 [Ustulina deusta]